MMLRFFYLMIGFITFGISTLNAEVDSLRISNKSIIMEDFKFFPSDVCKYYYPKPSRITTNQCENIMAVTTFGGLFLLTDSKIQSQISSLNHSTEMERAAKYIEPFGNYYLFIPTGFLGLYGLIGHQPRQINASFGVSESIVLSSLSTFGLKLLFERERPYQSSNQFAFHGPVGKWDFKSFPSGHTEAIFSFVAFLSTYYPEKKWIKYIGYPLGILTGFSRVYSNDHWMSDVFVGAAIGTATGVYLGKKRRNRYLTTFGKK